jgi:hypothetical protein
MVTPEGTSWTPSRLRVDNTMAKALARAYRWKRLIESGQFASVADLASAEKINQSYLCRVLRLTLLAPNLVEAILDGRQPATLQLETLLKPFPLEWEVQNRVLAPSAGRNGEPSEINHKASLTTGEPYG